MVKTSKYGDLAQTLFLWVLILQVIRPCKNSGGHTRLQKTGSEDFVWNVVQPFNSTKKTLKSPVFPDISETISLQIPTHFELFYYDFLH